jgi:hypothetical protein
VNGFVGYKNADPPKKSLRSGISFRAGLFLRSQELIRMGKGNKVRMKDLKESTNQRLSQCLSPGHHLCSNHFMATMIALTCHTRGSCLFGG